MSTYEDSEWLRTLAKTDLHAELPLTSVSIGPSGDSVADILHRIADAHDALIEAEKAAYDHAVDRKERGDDFVKTIGYLPQRVVGWGNVYRCCADHEPHFWIAGVYGSEIQADNAADHGRIACARIEFEL